MTSFTTGRDPVRESELLERDDEIAAATAVARDAVAGTGGVLLVEGPPGIGKSRLLDALAELADVTGLRTLRAGGGELERNLVFGLAHDLLAPLAEEEEGSSHATALGAAVLGAEANGVAAGGDQDAALHGLRWLVEAAADRRPLALLVDDAQWVDASSLLFLAYLARRIEALPAIMVVALRDAPPEDSGPAFEQLRRSARIRLRPEPLSEDAAATLLARALGSAPDGSFVRACRTAAGGNPFLMHELATELRVSGIAPSAEQATQVRATGPKTVARAVAARVEGIGPAAIAVTRAVAVLGRAAQPALVAELADCSLQVACDVVIALAWADVLVDERPLRFTHPVVRAAIYQALGRTERGRVHKRAAEVLLGAGRSADDVAAHLLVTDPSGNHAVVTTLREAGARAFAQGAPAATVDYLRRALDEPPSHREAPALRALLGTAELRLGDPRAVADLQRAVADAQGASERAGYSLPLGRALMIAGRGHESVIVLGEAADAVADADRELGLRLAAEAMFAARLAPPATEPARARLDRWGELSGTTFAERLALVAVAHSDALRLRCSASDAAELAGRGLAGGALFADEGPDSATPYRGSFTLALAERLDEAAAVNARGLEDSRIRGSALGFALASTAQADVELRRGELAHAEAHARTALDLTAESGLLAMFLPFLLAPLVVCLIERNEHEAADRLLVRRGLAGDLDEIGGSDVVLLARGRLRIAQGRPDDAIADLRQLGRWMEAWGTANPSAMPWRSSLASVLVRQGEIAEARELAAEELRLARRWGTPRAIGVALRSAGEAAGRKRSVALLEQAVHTLEASAGRLEHARALLSLGLSLRREGRRAPARDPLARAAELAEKLGAPALAEQAAEELRVAGARPRRVELSGYASLTASERRIVLLARDGASNRDIAESLWLSVKTVEMHLGNAYRKLGIASRRELAGALEQGSTTTVAG